MSQLALQILLIALVVVSIGGVIIAALFPHVTGRAKSNKRLERIAKQTTKTPKSRDKDGARRLREVGQTVKNVEDDKAADTKKARRVTLRARLRQAGLTWTKPTYWMVCFLAGLSTLVLVWGAFGSSLSIALVAGFCGALLLPHLFVSYKRKKRFQAFSSEFANALDIVVRGVKAGLPLVDCFKIIAAESAEPVRSEVRTVVDDQTLGISLDEAVKRMATRVPMAETNFLAVVLSVQSRTGGSLSDALGNLSRVLRDRKKMSGKIKAMSSEAKASAMIIGSLPVFVTAILFVVSRDYIMILFNTLTGNFVLVGSALWMLMGILVMRKMINFDY